MIESRNGRARLDRAAMWVSCLAVLCAASCFTWFRFTSAIDGERERGALAAAAFRADAARLAERPALEAAVRRLDAALGPLDLSADHATTVARFVREAARITALDGTRVLQIDQRAVDAQNATGGIGAARPGAPVAPAAAGRLTESNFETIALDVTVSGGFRDIVRTLRDLATAPIAARIEPAALERATDDDGTAPATLIARLTVDLERLRAPNAATAITPPIRLDTMDARRP